MPDANSTTDKAVDRMARVSMQIRDAMRNALPTPPEQFFTLDFIADSNETVAPNYIKVNEAKLCDDMPPLAGIQLGPTGRSVSRSYDAALAELIPNAAWPGIVDEGAGAGLTPEQERYKRAMEWLRKLAEIGTDGKELTRVGLYKRKLKSYTSAVEQKTKAFAAALELINHDPMNDTKEKRQAAFSDWVNQNGRRYNNLIQGAYMDFVTVGQKEQVEYWFAVVDNRSAMGRVEASKQAKRNATILDSDGILEHYRVDLSPSNWARLAREGVKPDRGREIKFKILRLQKLNSLLNALTAKAVAESAMKVLPNIDKLKESVGSQNEAVKSKLSDLFKVQQDFDSIGVLEVLSPMLKEIESAKQNPAMDQDKLEALNKAAQKFTNIVQTFPSEDWKILLDAQNAVSQMDNGPKDVIKKIDTAIEVVAAKRKTIKARWSALNKALEKIPEGTPGKEDFKKAWAAVQKPDGSGYTNPNGLKNLLEIAKNVSQEGIPSADYNNFQNALAAAARTNGVENLRDAQQALAKELAALDSAKMEQLSAESGASVRHLLEGDQKVLMKQIEDNKNEISRLQHILTGIVGEEQALRNFVGGAGNLGLDASSSKLDEKYFTHISLSVTQSDATSESNKSATSVSYGASGTYGLFSAGISGSHSRSSQDAEEQMAKASVNVSFDVMDKLELNGAMFQRVDISRQWLHTELFYDPELTTSQTVFISQGPRALARQIQPSAFGEEKTPANELNGGTFPAFPTAFFIAANVVLDIQGESSAITQHFNASADAVSGSIGYGPFSVSTSVSHSEEHASSTCTSTATGCRPQTRFAEVSRFIHLKSLVGSPSSFRNYRVHSTSYNFFILLRYWIRYLT
ncbi:hypothetical protein DL93DRAFT_2103586 [Clavulina sp. PMI_390]|nr:hypothetical protein DL93DRAFT_2103586 [Clavulina sp. PMI_390]